MRTPKWLTSMWTRDRKAERRTCPECGSEIPLTTCEVCGYDVIRRTRDTVYPRVMI